MSNLSHGIKHWRKSLYDPLRLLLSLQSCRLASFSATELACKSPGGHYADL